MKRQRGFGMIELIVVAVIVLVIAAVAIPQVSGILNEQRVMSDARSIASQLTLAKMRAADGFTQTRLNCSTTARTCQLQVCTTKSASTCTTFTDEGGPVLLSDGVVFGFSGISTPAGSQTTISNTAQIIFNSRSLPVDTSGAASGSYALYLRGASGDTYAVTVYASGRVAVWQYEGDAWNIL